MLVRRDIVLAVAVGVGLITAGSVWLWGPVPLIVIGILVILATTFIDY